MRVVVAAWVGSSNLGDELVHAGLRRLLAQHGVQVAAITLDPAATRAAHGGIAISHRDPGRINRAVRSADAVLFGGGGLLQDTTSPFNLPYHLARLLPARRHHIPVAAVGLGVGPLETRLGRALARRGLRGLVGCTVRDAASRELLAELVDCDIEVAADLAFALPAPRSADRATNRATGRATDRATGRATGRATDRATGHATGPPPREPGRLVVSLRPWGGGRSRLPAAARGDDTPEEAVHALAAALDAAVDASGHTCRFVALQADRDDAFHRRVAAQMRTPATFATPHLDGLLDEFAAASAVISMRYHGGVAATLAGRPAVLLGYDPKVAALAGELGAGARLLAFDAAALPGIPAALAEVTGHADAVVAARRTLQRRQAPTAELLSRMLQR